MTLTLRAVSLNDLPLTQPITAQFGPQGGTIGRADGNTLALPDPERHISRQQAEIRPSGDGYLILNTGSANPITVAGQSLAQGQSLQVRDRDEIRMGGYLLQVSIAAVDDTNMMLSPRVDGPAPSAHRVASAPAFGAAPSAGALDGFGSGRPLSSAAVPSSPLPPPLPASDPFGDLLGGSAGSASSAGSSGNPFADLLGAPPPPAPRTAFGQTHKTAPVAAPPPTVALLPDDFDPFAPPPSPTRAPAAASSTGGFDFGGLGAPVAPSAVPRSHQDFSVAGGGAFGDLIPSSGSGASSLDDMFGLQPGGGGSVDPLAGFMAGATQGLGDATSSGLPTDPLALFGDAPAKPSHSEPVTPALADHTSALNSSFRPPEVRQTATSSRPAGATTAQPSGATIPPSGAAVQPVGATTQPVLAPSAGLGSPSSASTIPLDALPPDVLAPPATARSPHLSSGLAPVPPTPSDIATPMFMDSEAGGLVSSPPSPRPGARPQPQQQPHLQAYAQPTPHQPQQSTARVQAQVQGQGQGQAQGVPPSHGTTASAAGPVDATTAAALWQAFSEGAGIRFEAAQGLTPDLMRVIGQLLRSSVDGTLQMMAVRAATKHELRAQVTVIRSRDNNPLKFSPDAQAALEQLLQPPVRGFLPGPAAMSDAMHDLVGHTIGTMAGTRAALEGVLGRFKPEMLESKLTSRSVLDSVLTLNRKAKLWELYLQHFESIREEAQEDFHNLFGKAFLEAYEEQLERLNQRKTAA